MLLRVRSRCSDQDGGQAMTGGWHLSDSSVLLIPVGSGLTEPEPGASQIVQSARVWHTRTGAMMRRKVYIVSCGFCAVMR